MALRETTEQALERWRNLELLQEHYAEFGDFLTDVMEEQLGFKCSPQQIDIGNYMATGPRLKMVQAQRSQAKTTIAAIFAVWRLIHDPKTRVLIISAGDTQASEIANLVIQIIMNMDELECLRPDRANGDRSSIEAFDVHYSLKGTEKSPAVACIGITANMQGKRADLLISDDIESQKNSQTQVQRDRLKLLSKDFTSICSKGDILWLGTPQSVESIYNDLPGRGYDVRIWPGRFPTAKEIPHYGSFLAPYVLVRLELDPSLQSGGGPDGTRGKATDPVILDEDTLIGKEIDQGPAYFQLQYMLSTKLSDELRFPLKLSKIRFLGFDTENRYAPMALDFVPTMENKLFVPDNYPVKDVMYQVQGATEFGAIPSWHMYIDPAGGGQNGDDTAFAFSGFMAGMVYVPLVGAVPGGLEEESLDALVEIIKTMKPSTISIEKNFGNGALSSVLQPKVLKVHKCGIEDVWEAGQKELRIIDTLEPIINSGKLVVHEDVLRDDIACLPKYNLDVRNTYSLFWQLGRITRDKGSLIHDDKADALAGSIRPWVELLKIDNDKAQAKAKQDQYNKMMQNPLGHNRPVPGHIGKVFHQPNVLSRFMRRF